MSLREHIKLYDDDTGTIYKENDFEKDLRIYKAPRMFRKVMYSNIPAELGLKDLGCWYKLLKYLEQNTNRLVFRKRDSRNNIFHESVTTGDLEEILDISQSSVYRFLKRTIGYGYIAKVTVEVGESKRVEYYMSPKYVMNGSWVSPEIALIFSDSQDFISSLSIEDKAIIKEYTSVIGISRLESVEEK